MFQQHLGAKMPRPNRTRYTVLGALTHGPMSGYDIKKFIEGTTNNFWRESYGQIYPTLKQLTAEGLVTRSRVQQEGKPDRYVYTLADEGREELREWLLEPAESEVPRVELLLKLFFGHQISVDANLRHVERHATDIQRGLKHLRGIDAMLSAKHGEHPAIPYSLLVLRQGILIHEALERWCHEARETLIGLGASASE
jgi:DNA-binding PadR family transcriptional regulator